MTVVLLDGRKLPPQDWEGDDFTPGAGGKFVTCTDTACGRQAYWATNGRVNIDGKEIRAAIFPRDPDGTNLPQLEKPVLKLTGVQLIRPAGWDIADALAHLRGRPGLHKGLVMQGWYAAIPRQYRFQANADFGHALWASHFSPTSGVRVWDALDANLTHHGQWIPWRFIAAFLEQWRVRAGAHGLLVAYSELQPLKAA